MTENPSESRRYIEAEVRSHDPDRYLTTLFAPPAARPRLWALYAFNAELARVRETVSEPMMGEIRLQWWRDTISGLAAGGEAPRQPVAEALAASVAAGRLSPERLIRLVDARSGELYDEIPADMADLERRITATAGDLAVAAVEMLHGADDGDLVAAARSAGVAWGLTAIIRSVPGHAAAGRTFMPQDRLTAYGLRVADLAGEEAEGRAALVGEIGERARSHIAEARRAVSRPPAAVRNVFLMASLAESYLTALRRTRFDLTRDIAGRAAAGRIAKLWWKGLRGGF